jgi:hypothetical protein
LELFTLKNRSLSAVPAPTYSPQPGPSLTGISTNPARTSRIASLARLATILLLASATLGLSSCHSAAYYYYKFPQYTYAGRPVPPSKLAQRVMIAVSANGSVGSLQIVDALRDIRTNVEDTIPGFSISGYSSGFPSTIFNLFLQRRQPEQDQLLQ